MKKIISSLFITSLFFLFTATPSFASSTLTVSNPRVVNNDFNIDIQISGAPDNICSWWNSLHNVYVVDLNGNRLHNFSSCGYVTTDPDGTVHYTFSGAPQPPTGTYKIEVVEQEQNNYDVISNNTFGWTSTINFPPTVQAPANAVLIPGQVYSGKGSFTDADSSSWTATVNYGDGSGAQPLILSGMNYSLNHTYTQNGGYQIAITVTDEHGNSGTATAQVHVELYDLSVSNPRLNSSGEFTIDLNISAPDNVCSWWTSLHHAYIVDATTGQQEHDFAGCSSNGGNNYTISGVGVLPTGTYKIEVLESEQPGLNGGNYDVISTNSFVWSGNHPPQLSSLSGATINEGGTYNENGSFADTDSTSWTATVDYGDGSGSQSLSLSGMNFSLSHKYKDEGFYTVIVKVTDNQGATGTATATITVNNATPTVGTISVPATAGLNTSIIASANFTDPGVLDTHTAKWNWGDGNTTTGTVTETNGSGSVTNSHTYTALGSYTITLTVTDDDGLISTSQFIVAVIPASGLSGSNLSHTNYSGANLSNQNLSKANLSVATFNNVDFQSANLSQVNGSNSSFTNDNFTGVNLNKVDFSNSNLTGSNFTNAILTQGNISNANLTKVNFTGADLQGANLSGAVITGVIWSNTICPDGTNSNNDNNTCTGHGGGL